MPPHRLDWTTLLTTERLKSGAATPKIEDPSWFVASRDESERDFDRILYAASTRRLGDKTQVFPLDRTDTVRNRLTHSHEVSNLARSIGTYLVNSPTFEALMNDCTGSDREAAAQALRRRIPAILAAAGLAHDMGNPPFGHQGEEAIRSWFEANANLFAADGPDKAWNANLALTTPDERFLNDFRIFEGNAQTIRTLSRLQVVKDDRGLNLTFASIAALLKYTVGSNGIDNAGGRAATKKCGFFASEAAFVATARDACGLHGYLRHPLTYLMEACDDIAYLVADAEDAIKKRAASFADLLAWLDEHKKVEGKDDDALIDFLVKRGRADATEARKAGVPPSEVNDVAMQIFRAKAITAMVSATISVFKDNYDRLMTVGLDGGLLELGSSKRLASGLKGFDTAHAYSNRGVLEIELKGCNVIKETMTMLWKGISQRESFEKPSSRRRDPFARYAYGRISENYRRVFERTSPSTGRDNADLPIRYRELQLLSDMIAGMTDRFAIDLHRELKAYANDAPAQD